MMKPVHCTATDRFGRFQTESWQDNREWQSARTRFTRRGLSMTRIIGCITVGALLLGSVAGASAQQSDAITDFFWAAFNGDLDKLKELVANGMDVNTQAPGGGLYKRGTTALHIAATGNHLAMVNFLLNAKANVNIANIDGSIPLHSAAEQGHAAIAKALLNAHAGGIGTLKKDGKGRTPLHLAVVSDGATVTLLLEARANVHAKDNDGRTPLQYGKSKANAKGLTVLTNFLNTMVQNFMSAAVQGNTSKLKQLLRNGIDIDVQADGTHNWKKGITALHVAVIYRRRNAVEFLLDNSRIRGPANPNIYDSEGKTPLHRVAEHDDNSDVALRQGIVTALLDAGANVYAHVKAGNKSGWTAEEIAREIARQEGRAAIVADQLRNFAWSLHDLLKTAVDDGNVILIRRLIRNGASVHTINHLHRAVRKTSRAAVTIAALLTAYVNTKEQNSAMHVAINVGNAEAVKALLAGGADVNYKDAFGKVPLHIAATKGNPAVVKALLDGGADEAIKDRFGKTAQQIAFEKGHTGLIPLLGKYVPPPPPPAQQLWNAVEANDPDEVKRLIRLGVNVNAGVDMNARVKVGRTALHRAIQYDSDLEIIQSLLVAGADPTLLFSSISIWNLSNSLFRVTALHLAVKWGRLAAAELMLAHYGETLLPLQEGSRKGNTALHFAAEQGDRALVELMVGYWPDVLDRGNGAQIDPNNPSNREASIPNREGKTPRQLALDKGHTEVAEALNGLETLTRNAELHQTIAGSDDPALIEALLDQGASVETRSNLIVNTPLHTAVLYKRPAVAKFLLEEDASTEARNASGETPLHYAALTANADMVAILLAAEAEVDVQNVQGRTPLHYAVTVGAEDVEKMLLDAGADATIEDWDGQTARQAD